jgi:hypothetical protein
LSSEAVDSIVLSARAAHHHQPGACLQSIVGLQSIVTLGFYKPLIAAFSELVSGFTKHRSHRGLTTRWQHASCTFTGRLLAVL